MDAYKNLSKTLSQNNANMIRSSSSTGVRLNNGTSRVANQGQRNSGISKTGGGSVMLNPDSLGTPLIQSNERKPPF